MQEALKMVRLIGVKTRKPTELSGGQQQRVTLPQLYPAVLAGALLAFTFSYDDFILTY